MPDPEIAIRPEDMPELSHRPTGPDASNLELLQEKNALGDIQFNAWEEDFADSLSMCVEENRQWTTKQAEKFDELLEKYPTL